MATSARTDSAIDRLISLRDAPQESTAIRQIETFAPTGATIYVDPSSGERRSEFEPEDGILTRLRDFRDTLLNQTLANNPLQEAAAPAIRKLGALAESITVGEDRTALDIIENIGKGAVIGSIVIPDDAAVDPENPMPAVQIGAALIGAGAEGAIGELQLLRGINAVAKARQGTNLGRSAETALRLFGQGEDLSTLQRIFGGALGGAVTEVGLQTLALQDPEDIVFNAGLVGLGGAILGGSITGVAQGTRAARATPRAARAFAEEFARKTPVQRAEAQAGFDVALRTPPDEAGIGALTENIQRVERAIEDAASVRATTTKPAVTETQALRLMDDDLESLFDVDTSVSFRERLRSGFDAATEAWRKSFVFEAEMQRFRSMTGLADLNLGDDFRTLRVAFDRAPRLAIKEIRNVTAPLMDLKGKDFTNAYRQFERLVFLRDFAETAERGLPLPLGVSLETVTRELKLLENFSVKAAKEAADNHLTFVRGIREELIRRGKLDAGSGYDHYVPHVIIEDLAQTDARLLGDVDPDALNFFTGRLTKDGALQTPSRPQTRKREGSTRRILTDYADIMYRAYRRFHVDNAIDDFLGDINTNFGLVTRELSEAERNALSRVGRFKRGNEEFVRWHPGGPRYYPASSVDEEVFNVVRERIREGAGVDVDDLPDLREILAVGKRPEYILPAPIADRLSQFYAPSPFRGTLLTPFQRATSWWKRNTIWWGLSRFFMFQIVGDAMNLMRSNPAAFAHIGKAISNIFDAYGTPKMSTTQALATLAGGVGGLTIDEAVQSGDSTASSILAGAGLGYLLGTRRVAGTRRIFSELYDEADRLGAINSGFVFQEEELARRILGGRASHLPTRTERPWLRGLDTVTTLLSGKTHGDPYAFARVPAEMIETIQTERENVLRFASYIQQVEKGIDPLIASKNARESLVDYGKFTDFENKFIRGFLLPFYSFYRHNIPNWLRASVGREGVGKGATVGMAAVTGIAAFDLIAQAWNETFFPEIERSLDDFRRERFHIILGNPSTREPYTDVDGRPMVVGWEMPYEQALEFMGLARPGMVYSELFGVGSERETVDFTERARRKAEDLATLAPIRKFTMDLLTPIVKEPVQVAINRDLFIDAPIVPERYVGTEEGKRRMLRHVGRTFFRQMREIQRTTSDISGKRFDPLTSAFGLGLPVERVNLDRELVGFLHERMSETQEETVRIQADWKKAIDDIIYSRENFRALPQDEPQAVMDAIMVNSDDPADAEAAWRYYMNRGANSSLERQWGSMSNVERARFFNSLPDWAQTALVFFMNGGEQIDVFADDSRTPIG